jgi:hypothetical protein
MQILVFARFTKYRGTSIEQAMAKVHILLRSTLLIALIVLTATSQAQSLHFTQSTTDCACSKDHKDPLEEPQAFNFGRFQGQCIDSCRYRPARILKISLKKGSIQVGNILHLGSFYRTTIHLGDIQSAEAGFEEFLPFVHHVFLKFTLKTSAPDLELINQIDPHSDKAHVRSLVISSEGVPPKDHHYNIVESYYGNYLLAHRLATGDEMQRWTQKLGHPLKLFALNTQADVASKILLKSIQESDKQKLQNVYQLFTNNCSTSALSFIDSELPISSPVAPESSWTKFEEALPITGPIGTLRALLKRKLVDRQTL